MEMHRVSCETSTSKTPHDVVRKVLGSRSEDMVLGEGIQENRSDVNERLKSQDLY